MKVAPCRCEVAHEDRLTVDRDRDTWTVWCRGCLGAVARLELASARGAWLAAVLLLVACAEQDGSGRMDCNYTAGEGWECEPTQLGQEGTR